LLGLFQVYKTNPYEISVENGVWTSKNPIIIKLIKRINKGKSSLLPFQKGRGIYWILLSMSEQDLLKTISEMKQLLLPYFSQSVSESKQFFEPESVLGKYGSQLYSNGYYMFHSSSQQEPIVLERLNMWIGLDERRPTIAYDELEVNVFRLRSKFRKAISLKKWDEAQETLLDLQHGHFLTDENIKFLKVQLLSSQGKWEEIWTSSDFDLLAGLNKLPRRVQSELLHSYYQSKLMLLDVSEEFDESYTVYKDTRQRLGSLLLSQLGLDEDLLLRVFAYEAAFTKQLDKLERYLEKAEEELTINLIKFLMNKLKADTPPPIPVEEEKPQIVKAREYYQAEKYEDAYIALQESETSVEKVALLAGIATLKEIDEILEMTYQEFQYLNGDDKHILRSRPATKGNIIYVLQWKEGVNVITPSDKEEVVVPEKLSWNHWFSHLLNSDIDLDYMEEKLHSLDEESDSVTFSFKTLQGLSDQVMELAIEDFSSDQKILLNTAIPMFVSHLMLDKQFPNYKAINVYEYTIELLFTHAKKNADNTSFVLRLMEAVLTLDVEYSEKFWSNIKEWFNIPPVERLSQRLLEAIELFKDFGVDNKELLEIWSNWAIGLMERFSNEKTTVIQSWVKLGKEIGGDSYILESIEANIEEVEESDPISTLEKGVVTIYSLREKSAVRAAERIRDRNPNLKVRVCTDDKLTNEAKSYAANSDFVILVTTCMSHALFYGISPFLKNKPIYPRSSGETSIVEAFETHLVDDQEVERVS
jgi:hypothetical protein